MLLPATVVVLCLYRSVLYAWDSIGSAARSTNPAAPAGFIAAARPLLASPCLVIIPAAVLIISLAYLLWLTVLYAITKSRQNLLQFIRQLKEENRKLRRQIRTLTPARHRNAQYPEFAHETPKNNLPKINPKKMKSLAQLANNLRKQN
jgi:hypothetical protein